MIYNKKRKQPIIHAAWLAIFNGKVGCFKGDKILKPRILLWILRALHSGASGLAEMFPFINDKSTSIHCTPFPWDPEKKKYILPEKGKPYKWNPLFFEALDFACKCLLFLYPEDASFKWRYNDHCGVKDGREKFSPWYINNLGIRGFHGMDSKTKYARSMYENVIIDRLNYWARKGLTVYHVFCNEGITSYVPACWEWYKNLSNKIYFPKGKTAEQYMLSGFQNLSPGHIHWKSLRKLIVSIATKKNRPLIKWAWIKKEIEGMVKKMGNRKAKAWGERIELDMRATRHQCIKTDHLPGIVANPANMPKRKSSDESNDGDSVRRDKDGNRIRHTGRHIVDYYYVFIKKARNFLNIFNPLRFSIKREWFFEFLCWDNTFKCEGIRDFADLVWKKLAGKELHMRGKFEKEINIVKNIIDEDETQDIDLETVFLPRENKPVPAPEIKEDPKEKDPEIKPKEKKQMKNFVDFKGYFDTIKEKFFTPVFILSMSLAGIIGYWIKPRFIFWGTIVALVGYGASLIVNAIKK